MTPGLLPPGRVTEERAFPTAVLAWGGLLAAIALALRVYRLDAHELWLDEVFSYHLATVQTGLGEALRQESSPPLYYLLLRGWIALAGESEAAIRLLSVLFGTLFVPAMMWAGAELFNRRVGIWSGAFAAIAPIQVYYSQEARTYTFLMLSLAGLYALLWRAMRRNTWASWLPVSVLAAALLYSHYLSVLALLPMASLLWLWPKEERREASLNKFLAAGLLSALLFLPWWLWGFVVHSHGYLQEDVNWMTGLWKETPPALAIPKSLEILVQGSHAGFVPHFFKQFSALEWSSSWRMLGLGIFALLGVWALIPAGERILAIPGLGRRKAWCLLQVVFPLAGLWMLSLYQPIYIVGRYDILAFPAMCLLIGLGLAKLQSLGRYGPALGLAGGLLAALPIGVKLAAYYETPPASSQRSIARVIHTLVRNGDVVVLTGVLPLPLYGYYLPRLGYEWKNGVCGNQTAGRRFGCRNFPMETERSFANINGVRASYVYEMEAVRNNVAQYLGQLDRGGTLWGVFEQGMFMEGHLLVPPPDDLFVMELDRQGLHPQLLPGAETSGIYRFTSSPAIGQSGP